MIISPPKLSIYNFSFDGLNYSYTDHKLSIEIRLEHSSSGFNVSLYNLQGVLIHKRISTDTSHDDYAPLFHHFAINSALHIANDLYKHYYISNYDDSISKQNSLLPPKS